MFLYTHTINLNKIASQASRTAGFIYKNSTVKNE